MLGGISALAVSGCAAGSRQNEHLNFLRIEDGPRGGNSVVIRLRDHRLGISVPVPTIQPDTGRATGTALDIMPEGDAEDHPSGNLVWVDLCSTDLIRNPRAPVSVGRFGINKAGRVQIGTKGYNGGRAGSLELTHDGRAIATVSAHGMETRTLREAEDSEAFPSEWLDAWGAVEWRQAGLWGPQLAGAFLARGIDIGTTGLCVRQAGRWLIDHDRCLAIEAAYQRRRMDRLEAMLPG